MARTKPTEVEPVPHPVQQLAGLVSEPVDPTLLHAAVLAGAQAERQGTPIDAESQAVLDRDAARSAALRAHAADQLARESGFSPGPGAAAGYQPQSGPDYYDTVAGLTEAGPGSYGATMPAGFDPRLVVGTDGSLSTALAPLPGSKAASGYKVRQDRTAAGDGRKPAVGGWGIGSNRNRGKQW